MVFDSSWKPSPVTHESVILGAGGIASMSLEVAKFFHGLFQGRIIDPSSLEQMTNLVEGWGLGFIPIRYSKDQTGYGHTGGLDGFKSVVGYFEDTDTVFVNLLNGVSMNNNKIFLAMAASHYGDPFDQPEFQEVVAVPQKLLNTYSGKYAAEGFPFPAYITTKNGELYLKIEGQTEVYLESHSWTQFGVPIVLAKLIFQLDGSSFELIQGAKTTFVRQ